ncbi:hypothetical protein AJ85_04760 [Alkalihalobacillus alcalophilus ATCC 27647 = CGMCC 1.3604]|uniref:Uncharacterized protein n=1 Tax=Alkalihalobacillus alcalophilus ATCC 27647 = CGMCC 1.3604 TaxID=1218173 RepID=A0A094YVT1_ALKAL|nr:hypothetical protein [Alkalihalobacillus alcalophilus]KGA97627.1 hypothetical protein BALCAV_0209245 [Alkalihalobacillus alcalophilus ATCC 27647 = CGMCC 1.3604]MED1561415.1 hypothetical protein [Alkalihalobacillus alcalophilus]THG91449.1 hypothetical protein AJ85_04760 [Alkalihalobacillus alcalophilus ATCC 27647 = CGMCC 1.3604]
MELLDWLKENYQWKEAQFINQAILETDQGRKKIQYWLNKEILDWHIVWRDCCSVTPHVLVDRMIRTKAEEPFVEWKDGWVTVHDEIEDYFLEKGKEIEWGTFFGALIRFGQLTKAEVKEQKRFSRKYEEISNLLPVIKSEQRAILSDCLKEVHFRVKKSEQLVKLAGSEQVPLMDNIYSVRQAKKVYEVLFWNGTVEAPVRSYQGLRQLFLYWLQEHGEESLEKVVETMRTVEGFPDEQVMLFIAECLIPYELNRVAEEIQRTDVTDHDIEQAIRFSLIEWERSKKLVTFMSRWLDQKKKVSTR